MAFQKILEKDPSHMNRCLSAYAEQLKAYVDRNLHMFLTKHPTKLHIPLPSDFLLLPALGITSTTSADMSAFREPMQHKNLLSAFARTGQYEAAGTIWMLDCCTPVCTDVLTLAQMESAYAQWSEETFML